MLTEILQCPKESQIRRPSVQTVKASKNTFATQTSSQKKKIGTGKSKVLADAVGEEVFFYVDLSVPMRKKELTWS